AERKLALPAHPKQGRVIDASNRHFHPSERERASLGEVLEAERPNDRLFHGIVGQYPAQERLEISGGALNPEGSDCPDVLDREPEIAEDRQRTLSLGVRHSRFGQDMDGFVRVAKLTADALVEYRAVSPAPAVRRGQASATIGVP